MPVYITPAGARRRWKARPVHRAPVQGQTFLDGGCDAPKFPCCVFFICLVTQKTLPEALNGPMQLSCSMLLSSKFGHQIDSKIGYQMVACTLYNDISCIFGPTYLGPKFGHQMVLLALFRNFHVVPLLLTHLATW